VGESIPLRPYPRKRVFRFEGLPPQEGGGTWQPPARNLHGMGCKVGNTGLTDTPISGVTLKLHLVFVPDLLSPVRWSDLHPWSGWNPSTAACGGAGAARRGRGNRVRAGANMVWSLGAPMSVLCLDCVSSTAHRTQSSDVICRRIAAPGVAATPGAVVALGPVGVVGGVALLGQDVQAGEPAQHLVGGSLCSEKPAKRPGDK
jgi:hypothetical protein